MRERLNNNPMVQVGLIAVLLLAAALFVMSSMGGGSGEEDAPEASTSGVTSEGTTELAVTTAGTAAPAEAAAVPPPPGALAAAAPPPPSDVTSAFESGQTVVLLFVRNGGIDDRLVAGATKQLASLPGVAVFVVPASRIARYARITQGVGVSRVPALVVVRPKRLDGRIPTASVRYGFQSPASVEQAVIDAGYRGPTVDYHP